MCHRHEEEELCQAVDHIQRNCSKMKQQPCPFDFKLLDKREWKSQEPVEAEQKASLTIKSRYRALNTESNNIALQSSSGNLEDQEILLLTSSGPAAEYYGKYLQFTIL